MLARRAIVSLSNACEDCNDLALSFRLGLLHHSARPERAKPERRGSHERETWDDGEEGSTLPHRSKTRTEWLQEAAALETLGGEWQTRHTAAFCGLSVGALLRSACPRSRLCGDRSVKGRGRLSFTPADVRLWNSSRIERAA